jgi:hypothetical protein
MAHAQVREEQLVPAAPAERVEQVRHSPAAPESQPEWAQLREGQKEQAQGPSRARPGWRWVPDPSEVGLPEPPRATELGRVDADRVWVFAWARALGLW